MSIESLVADSSKSSNYTVVAFGDAVVLVSGSGAVVNNLVVAVYSADVGVSGTDIGLSSEEVFKAAPPLAGPLGASAVTNPTSYIIHQC